MATPARTQARSAGSTVSKATQQSRQVGLAVAEDAEVAIGHSVRATVDTMTTMAEVNQRVNREMVAFATSGTKEMFKLWAELQGATMDAFQATFGSWTTPEPVLAGWQRLVDGNTQAFGRFAQVVQQTAEQSTDRVKEAVETLADQVKENGSHVTAIADAVENDGAALDGR